MTTQTEVPSEWSYLDGVRYGFVPTDAGRGASSTAKGGMDTPAAGSWQPLCNADRALPAFCVESDPDCDRCLARDGHNETCKPWPPAPPPAPPVVCPSHLHSMTKHGKGALLWSATESSGAGTAGVVPPSILADVSPVSLMLIAQAAFVASAVAYLRRQRRSSSSSSSSSAGLARATECDEAPSADYVAFK